MEDLPVSNNFDVQSHRGAYSVFFNDALLSDLTDFVKEDYHFLVDANVARLYATELQTVLEHSNTIVVDATEENKSIEKIIPVIEKLVKNKIRRDHSLIAIGGGIIQDITCFIASTLLRGIPWRLVPTTLLAQADSCIGSKSSINLGATKNILGTFNPPQNIIIDTGFIDTLEKKEIHSGVGEIIKVHAIEGIKAFDQLAIDFDRLFDDRTILQKYIRSALLIKQRFIEEDEFDRGIRNIFNYGHSFGHAIESATNYEIPHGIAVTIGMDMANYIAVKRGLLPVIHYHRMHAIMAKNYEDYVSTSIPVKAMLSALMKDKKNTSTMLGLILPVGDDAVIQRIQVSPDEEFRLECAQFFAEMSS